MKVRNRKRKVFHPTVITDRMIDRVAFKSVRILEDTCMKVDNDVAGFDTIQDWFSRSMQVAEKLADRVAVAEHCVRHRVGWKGYRRIVKAVLS